MTDHTASPEPAPMSEQPAGLDGEWWLKEMPMYGADKGEVPRATKWWVLDSFDECVLTVSDEAIARQIVTDHTAAAERDQALAAERSTAEQNSLLIEELQETQAEVERLRAALKEWAGHE